MGASCGLLRYHQLYRVTVGFSPGCLYVRRRPATSTLTVTRGHSGVSGAPPQGPASPGRYALLAYGRSAESELRARQVLHTLLDHVFDVDRDALMPKQQRDEPNEECDEHERQGEPRSHGGRVTY
jgi:hypothetical protein